MKLLCKMFGHRPAFGYGDIEGQGYFEVELDARDGIGRQHARLYCNCQRCGVRYRVGMIHVPNVVTPVLPMVYAANCLKCSGNTFLPKGIHGYMRCTTCDYIVSPERWKNMLAAYKI